MFWQTQILPCRNIFCRFFQRPAHECPRVNCEGMLKKAFCKFLILETRRYYEEKDTEKDISDLEIYERQ